MATRKVIDIVQEGEKVYPKAHAQATYMSDGKTVEDAINEIGVGGYEPYVISAFTLANIVDAYENGGVLGVNAEAFAEELDYITTAAEFGIPVSIMEHESMPQSSIRASRIVRDELLYLEFPYLGGSFFLECPIGSGLIDITYQGASIDVNGQKYSGAYNHIDLGAVVREVKINGDTYSPNQTGQVDLGNIEAGESSSTTIYYLQSIELETVLGTLEGGGSSAYPQDEDLYAQDIAAIQNAAINGLRIAMFHNSKDATIVASEVSWEDGYMLTFPYADGSIQLELWDNMGTGITISFIGTRIQLNGTTYSSNKPYEPINLGDVGGGTTTKPYVLQAVSLGELTASSVGEHTLYDRDYQKVGEDLTALQKAAIGEGVVAMSYPNNEGGTLGYIYSTAVKAGGEEYGADVQFYLNGATFTLHYPLAPSDENSDINISVLRQGEKEVIYVDTAEIQEMKPNVIYKIPLNTQVTIHSFAPAEVDDMRKGAAYDVFTAILELENTFDDDSPIITIVDNIMWPNGEIPVITEGYWILSITRYTEYSGVVGEPYVEYYGELTPFKPLN